MSIMHYEWMIEINRDDIASLGTWDYWWFGWRMIGTLYVSCVLLLHDKQTWRGRIHQQQLLPGQCVPSVLCSPTRFYSVHRQLTDLRRRSSPRGRRRRQIRRGGWRWRASWWYLFGVNEVKICGSSMRLVRAHHARRIRSTMKRPSVWKNKYDWEHQNIF